MPPILEWDPNALERLRQEQNPERYRPEEGPSDQPTVSDGIYEPNRGQRPQGPKKERGVAEINFELKKGEKN